MRSRGDGRRLRVMAASELPGGSVTFVFTDIEGGAQRGGARERLRSIVERHGGSSVASEQGVLAGFRTAAAGVAVAAEAQRVLGSDLPGLGLHSGDGEADAAMRLAASLAAA